MITDDNRISAALPDEDIAAILEALKSIRDRLPFLGEPDGSAEAGAAEDKGQVGGVRWQIRDHILIHRERHYSSHHGQKEASLTRKSPQKRIEIRKNLIRIS